MGLEKLKELLVDQKEVMEDVILDALKGIVSLDSQSGEVYLQEKFSELRPDAKICVFLMARKAAHLLGLADGEVTSATLIRERTGMPVGTVNPKLRSLLDRGVIAQNEHKEYFMPAHTLAIARQTIKGGINAT